MALQPWECVCEAAFIASCNGSKDWLSQTVHTWTSRNCIDMVELRTLRKSHNPGFIRWDLVPHRGTERNKQSRISRCKAGDRSHSDVRNGTQSSSTGGLWKLNKADNQTPASQPCWHLDLSPVGPILYFWPLRHPGVLHYDILLHLQLFASAQIGHQYPIQAHQYILKTVEVYQFQRVWESHLVATREQLWWNQTCYQRVPSSTWPCLKSL